MSDLNKNRILKGLSADELQVVNNCFDSISAVEGEYIFSENEKGDSLFLVEKGQIALRKQIVGDVQKKLFAASEGSVFGEFCFMDSGNRSACAYVEKDCELLVLSRSAFETACAQHPGIATKVFANLMVLVIERLRITNDAYRDAVEWGMEVSGSHKLNFHYIITEGIEVQLELSNGNTLSGTILQLEKSDAGHEVIMKDLDGNVRVIPYHAIVVVSS